MRSQPGGGRDAGPRRSADEHIGNSYPCVGQAMARRANRTRRAEPQSSQATWTTPWTGPAASTVWARRPLTAGRFTAFERNCKHSEQRRCRALQASNSGAQARIGSNDRHAREKPLSSLATIVPADHVRDRASTRLDWAQSSPSPSDRASVPAPASRAPA